MNTYARTYPDLLSADSVPVYPFEPAMRFHILSPATQVPKTFCQIGGQESADEIFRDRIDMRRNAEFSSENLLVDLERMIGKEGRIPSKELEQKDAEGPPVCRGAVPSRCNLEMHRER